MRCKGRERRFGNAGVRLEAAIEECGSAGGPTDARAGKKRQVTGALGTGGKRARDRKLRRGMAERKKAKSRSEPGQQISEARKRAAREKPQAGADWYEEKAALIDEILKRVEERLIGNDFKATVGDFIRLLEIRKALEEDRPREITVRWVEPSETEDAPA
jgi:hypothetical protein